MKCDRHLCCCSNKYYTLTLKLNEKELHRNRWIYRVYVITVCKCGYTVNPGSTNSEGGCLKRLLAIPGAFPEGRMKQQQFLATLPSHSPLETGVLGRFPILGERWKTRVCAEEGDQDDIGSRVHVHMDSSRSWGPEGLGAVSQWQLKGCRTEEGCNLIYVSSWGQNWDHWVEVKRRHISAYSCN